MSISKKYKSKKRSHNGFVRVFFILLALVLVCVGVVYVLNETGLWEKVNSIDKIKAIVEKGGVFSCVIFVFLQILQTTILQVPAIIVTLAGSLIFGKWLAFILSFVAIMIGSLIMFWIGRKAGVKFLTFLDRKSVV